MVLAPLNAAKGANLRLSNAYVVFQFAYAAAKKGAYLRLSASNVYVVFQFADNAAKCGSTN
jgi:hypothetical protein